MFYLLDKDLVNDKLQINQKKYYADLESKLSKSNPVAKYKTIKWYGYAAAAVLLIFIISFIFITNDQTPEKAVSENVVIQKALIDEDWVNLQRILKNDNEILKRANEKISLSLLVEKLAILEKQGVRSIDYIDLFKEANNVQNLFPSPYQDNKLSKIQINELVQTLERYKSSKSEITLYEIGLFLAETNKGGIKS
jgi:hypothetical protein